MTDRVDGHSETGRAMWSFPIVARTSLRQVLWGLVFALTLPAILIAAAGFYSSYRAERDAMDQRLQETVRALASSLDREIEKSETALRALAFSQSVRDGDFAAFYEQVSQIGLARPSWVALIRPDGSVIFNTRLPYGVKLPDTSRPGDIRRVVETRQSQLSDLQSGQFTGQPLVLLDVPVVIADKVAYVLSVAIGFEVFQQLITDQRINDGWNGAILDKSGRIIARLRAPDQFVGQLARSALREAIAASPEGHVQSVTLDGVPVRSYFSRSAVYGWAFILSVPDVELSESVRRSLFWLFVMAGCIGVGIVLVAILSRLVARPVDQLVAAAQALAGGKDVEPATTRVLEFDTIQKAIADAAADLRDQEKGREEALARIAESEARLKLALNAGNLGSWEYTPSTGAFITSPACRANFGREPDEPFSYADLVASIHPDDRAHLVQAVAKAVSTRCDLHVEYRTIWPDGSEHWIRISGRMRVGPDERLSMVGVSQDITENKLAEERQAILLHELDHRVKNTLATVQSVASMTRRSAQQGDPAAWETFMGRIQGLAKTHDLLTASQWQGALLSDVLNNELEPYQDSMRQRIRLRGPKVNLQPSAVLALGLATHEMATNATKYGSLSSPEGRINVMWAVTPALNPPVLIVEWVESGGPRVMPPAREGFGTKLIQRGLAQQLGGEIKLDFRPEGIRCVITFPLQSVLALQEEPEPDEDRYAS
ncbi:sensor histidine kinase [Microvirga sp. 2YAF29]|uniref:sensor histidine kinase n=1 Tax=Microvirga sp. 2YAF29 TaxID=3233031 RepID=UPI003F96410E